MDRRAGIGHALRCQQKKRPDSLTERYVVVGERIPRGGYFGLAALVGPANLVDVHPSVTLNFTDKFNLDFDYDVFWRYSSHDGVYGPNAALIYSSSGIQDKLIGHQYAMVGEYVTSPFLHFGCELTYFVTGDFLRKAGSGKNLFFLCLTTEFKF